MNSLTYSKMRTPPSINGYACFGRFSRRKELWKCSEIATFVPAKIGIPTEATNHVLPFLMRSRIVPLMSQFL